MKDEVHPTFPSNPGRFWWPSSSWPWVYLDGLIILDIQLPEMDGYAVAQELRSNPALADVPIVAVTSYAMVGDRERILAAGCSGYMEKPINPETFMAEIEQHLWDFRFAISESKIEMEVYRDQTPDR